MEEVDYFPYFCWCHVGLVQSYRVNSPHQQETADQQKQHRVITAELSVQKFKFGNY